MPEARQPWWPLIWRGTLGSSVCFLLDLSFYCAGCFFPEEVRRLWWDFCTSDGDRWSSWDTNAHIQSLNLIKELENHSMFLTPAISSQIL
jgi:hypothetical protein